MAAKKSPVEWLPVHWDQLRTQRSVTSMGNFTFFSLHAKLVILEAVKDNGEEIITTVSVCSSETERSHMCSITKWR